jgi:hypothetical protein
VSLGREYSALPICAQGRSTELRARTTLRTIREHAHIGTYACEEAPWAGKMFVHGGNAGYGSNPGAGAVTLHELRVCGE